MPGYDKDAAIYAIEQLESVPVSNEVYKSWPLVEHLMFFRGF